MFLTLKLPLFAIADASVTTISPHCFHHTAQTFIILHIVSVSPLCPKCKIDECKLIVVSFLLSIIITILRLLPLFIYRSSCACAALSSTQHWPLHAIASLTSSSLFTLSGHDLMQVVDCYLYCCLDNCGSNLNSLAMSLTTGAPAATTVIFTSSH